VFSSVYLLHRSCHTFPMASSLTILHPLLNRIDKLFIVSTSLIDNNYVEGHVIFY
jgi:hypothetical protein